MKTTPTDTGNSKRLPALRLHLSCSLSGLKSSEMPSKHFLIPVTEAPSLISSIVGFFSGVVMIGVYFYNKNLAARIQSLGLKATAKGQPKRCDDEFLDGLSRIIRFLGLHWLDNIMAFVVGLLIVRTAVEVFIESAFQLTDGFDQTELDNYIPVILRHPEVKDIREIKARRYGSNVYIDLTVCMDKDLSVYKSHQITEFIEKRTL